MTGTRSAAWAIWLYVCAGISARAVAQVSQAEVVLTGDAVGGDGFEILRGAFSRDSIELKRASAAPLCVGALSATDVSARVWISWTSSSQPVPVQLCFQNQCSSIERALGPFARLDARAREELITVVESGLGALALSCATPETAAPANASPSEAVATPASVPPGASKSASVHDSQRATVRSEASPTSSRADEHNAPSTPTPILLSTSAPSVAVDTDSRGGSFAIGASLGIARWTDGVLAERIAARVTHAVATLPVYLGFEAGFEPTFRAAFETLAIEASCLRLSVLLGSRVKLGKRWSFEAQVGPSIEWLWLTPAIGSSLALRDSHSTSHADPSFFLRVGPVLRVYDRWLVGFEAEVAAAWVQRTFGFATDAGTRSVFEPDLVRVSLALNTRVEL